MLCIVYFISFLVNETIVISEMNIVIVSLLIIYHPAESLVLFLICIQSSVTIFLFRCKH